MPVRKYLNVAEIERLIDHDFGEMDNLLIQIGLSTGLRASEIVNIRLKKIFSDGIHIWDEKKDVYRPIVADGWLMFHIVEWSTGLKHPHGLRYRDQKLFYLSPKTLNRKVKRWFAELNIDAPARWHTFRHTYIRLMLDRMGDKAIQFICLQTGDKPATVLQYYAVPSMDDRIGVANDLRGYIGSINGEFSYDPIDGGYSL